MPEQEVDTTFAVRLKFETHGDRQEAFKRAINHFDKNFKEGWRLVFVEEELDTGYHEDVERVPDNDTWDCRYDAVGDLSGLHA